MYWVTPDAGSLDDFHWNHAIRRELKDRPGWLGKALDPFVRKGKERADGGYRLDLVFDLKKTVGAAQSSPGWARAARSRQERPGAA